MLQILYDYCLFIGAELFAKRRKKSERWVVDEVKSTEKTINRENSISQVKN